jgi:hypothetical protein
MHAIYIPAVIVASIIFSSCCSNVTKERGEVNIKDLQTQEKPTDIQINKSYITAEVDEIEIVDGTDFIITANILEVEKSDAYQSMASPGTKYKLKPNYRLKEDKTIDKNSDENKKLMSLAELKKGDRFEAEISYEGLNGWVINERIK